METQFSTDDALIARHLGPRYLGRRFLRYHELEALGLVDNRASLKLWMASGAFPRAIKIAGRRGKTLVWLAVEVAQMLAERIAERDGGDSETGATARPRPFDSTDPLEADRGQERTADVYPRT